MNSVNRDLLCPRCLDVERSLDPQKVITVRMPKSQHGRLKRESHAHGTSLNRLCLTKLAPPLPIDEPLECGAGI